MASDGKPILFQYSFSNFNEKARWALDYKQVPHIRHSLLPGSPRMLRFSQAGTIPVLDLDGERIVDSTAIIAALERRWPDPPLYPADEAERRRALELEEFVDEHAGHELRRVAFWDLRDDRAFVGALLATGQRGPGRWFVRATLPVGWLYATRRYGFREGEAERSRVELIAALDRLEAELSGRDYLVGDHFTVADLTAAALLFPLAWPDELQYAYPQPPRWEFRESLAERPIVAWIGEMYHRHRGTSAAVRG